MNCPPEIADCLLEIIKIGVLHIRNATKHPERCFNEADHIHNLPGLLKSFSPELLEFYLTVERPCYVKQAPEEWRRGFEPVWRQLDAVAKTVIDG